MWVKGNELLPSKKETDGIRVRIDADEFCFKDGALHFYAASKLAMADSYCPDDVKFPGIFALKLDTSKKGQKFLAEVLKDWEGKVFSGFITVDDSLALYDQCDNPVIANVMKGQCLSAVSVDNPQHIEPDELKAPTGGGKGGGRTYDPMAKFNALKAMLGEGYGGTLPEIAAGIDSLGDAKHTILELLKCVL